MEATEDRGGGYNQKVGNSGFPETRFSKDGVILGKTLDKRTHPVDFQAKPIKVSVLVYRFRSFLAETTGRKFLDKSACYPVFA